MLTVDVVRQVWEHVVTSHKSDVSFISNWNPVKDDRTDIDYPVCFWGGITTGEIPNAEVLASTFDIDLLFLDQTGSDRDNLQRDQAHSRMDAIARQCWTKFHDLYLVTTGTWQGQEVSFRDDTVARFQPIYDEGTQMRTGVRLTATIVSDQAPECVDEYFN